MARNEVFRDGRDISLLVGAGILSGDPVRVGSLNGVAQTDAADINGKNVNGIATGNTLNWASVACQGVHKVSVTTSAARAQGTPIYSAAPGANALAVLSDTNTGKLWGVLIEPTAGAATTVRAVKLVSITV